MQERILSGCRFINSISESFSLFLYKFITHLNLINSRYSLPVLQLGWTDLLEDAAYDRVIQGMNLLLQRAGDLAT